MTKMISDEQVYDDMAGDVTPEDILKMTRVLETWANATDKIDADIRTIFLCCIQTIQTMGPAYCKLGAVNLVKAVSELYEEDPKKGPKL